MQQAGSKTLALWREVGEWWAFEPGREVRRFVDADGVRREECSPLNPCVPDDSPVPYQEDHREEWSLRVRKLRDEKVAIACGYAPSAPTVHRRVHASPYAALHTLSGYAFGRSTMLAEEIPALCAQSGIPAAAIADPFSLVGCVEFSRSAHKHGVVPLIGASFELAEGGEIVLIARSKRGYESLSSLVTACCLEEPRLYPLATWQRLERFSRDLICLTGGDAGPINRLVTHRRFAEAREMLDRLVGLYGPSDVFIEIERSYLPWEMSSNSAMMDLAAVRGLTCVAGGAITHAHSEHFPAQDVLVCADTLCTVDEIIGRKPQRHPSQPQVQPRPTRALNSERRLRTPGEMSELFADAPELLANTLRVVERCDRDVLPSRTRLPEVFDNPNRTLHEVTFAGASKRHGKLSRDHRQRLEMELERIVRLDFATHFLIAWDMCNWSKQQGILFSGRGSVVDSAVSYCLGFSRIDAYEHNLLFDRFLPDDGSKRPDIDIDFEAKRRDDVRNYLVKSYGEEHVATVAAIGAYCSRGIVREVGKVLGLPSETIGYLAKKLHGAVSPEQLEEALSKRPELRDGNVPRERFKWVFRLAQRLTDIPRNMRAHSSGVVISSRPIHETVPVMWSASPGTAETDNTPNLRIMQWDKRSCKYYFDKFDILCLRGQDVLSGVQERIQVSQQSFEVEQIPLDDENTYRAMRSGELIGIPQSASPAMRQAHIRLRTENLNDASLVQAGIRPGVGGAVKINELIARRRGLKPYSFEHPELERILGITYGIVVFQEQIDQLLQAFCAYTSGEAEEIRDAIHKRRREDYGRLIREELVNRMVGRGHTQAVAEHVFELVAGFKGYGFAQGHALAFAEISIRSIYCQQNYPAEYFASILDAQPAGYYGPCTLANEARSRGVMILPPDVTRSGERFSVEDVKSPQDPQIVLPNAGIRVSLAQISGLSSETRKRIVAWQQRQDRRHDLSTFTVEVRPSRDEYEKLVLCGALDRLIMEHLLSQGVSLGEASLHRRRSLLWSIPQLLQYADAINDAKGDAGLLPCEMPFPSINWSIDEFDPIERAIHEREQMDLDVEQHLMAFERERIKSRGGITCSDAKQLPHRRKAIVVGNPIRLRFPPTPSGKRVVFFDLEDETGLLNVTCFDAVYRRDGHAIVCSPYVTLIGEAQDRDGHTAFLARRVFPYRPMIAKRLEETRLMPIATADFLVG